MGEPDSMISLLEQISRHLHELVEATERPASPWMDVRECARYTGFSESSIYDYVAKEIIPHSRPKGTGAIRFYRPTIDKWMSSYRRKGRSTYQLDIKLKGI